MIAIARGLENGNPFAYLLLFMILYPPILIIIFTAWDKIKPKLMNVGQKKLKYKGKEWD